MRTSRVLASLSAIALSLSLASCGGDTTTDDSAATDSTTTSDSSGNSAVDKEETEEIADSDESESEDDTIEINTKSVFDLEVGDCFLSLNTEDALTEVNALDCEHAHYAEVYSEVDLDDYDEYPGDDVISAEAEDFCLGSFEGYVGSDFQDSIYYLSYFSPSEDSWDNFLNPDRTISCILVMEDGSDWTGSAKGSGE